MEKVFIVFGRSAKDGTLEIYSGYDVGSVMKDSNNLVIQSEPFESRGADAQEIIRHLKEQIAYNSPFKTPVALHETWAITFNEATKLLEFLENAEFYINRAIDSQMERDKEKPTE